MHHSAEVRSLCGVAKARSRAKLPSLFSILKDLQEVGATHRPLIPAAHSEQRVGHDVLPTGRGVCGIESYEERKVDASNPVPGLL